MNPHHRRPLLAASFLAASVTAVQAGVFVTAEYSGHTYQLVGNVGGVNDERNYADAHAFAASLNYAGNPGHLVRIDDLGENGFVFSQIISFAGSLTSVANDGGLARYVWLGANDIATEGRWIWDAGGDQFWQGDKAGLQVSGLFNNWSVGTFYDPPQSEPDNAGLGGQNAAAMTLDRYPTTFPPEIYLGQPGAWNDISTDNTLPFMVEFDVVPEPAWTGLAVALSLGSFGLARRCLQRRGVVGTRAI